MGTDYSPYYDTTYGTTAVSSTNSGLMAGAIIMMFIIYIIIAISVYVISSIFLAKLFKKAGVEGWKAWVPFLNTWKLYEIGGQQGYWVLLGLLPIVNIVA